MKRFVSKAIALVSAGVLLSGCSAASNGAVSGPADRSASTPMKTPVSANESGNDMPAGLENEQSRRPKYVFLFIGDGMSFPQFQSASDYLGAMADSDYMMAAPSLDDNQGAVLDGPVALNFMEFETVGSVVTYDSNSFAPDSASTATSIATGHKTYSGSINVDETAMVSYETITEKVHDQLGMQVGVISSVNLNHATPAAFYAHQASRSSYYEIGLELIDSGFEYFAGGELLKPAGPDNDRENLYELAENAGYTVVRTQAEAEKVTSGPVILIDEHLADSSAMAYELDRTNEMWSLADYVKKGIDVLDNENGFFLMCEGGKIDWACHANDAAAAIHDTLALADAVQVAVDFAKDHAEETLILVTGDHETGGLTIGFAGTNYDTYLSLLDSQKISFARYDSDYVSAYKENHTPFEEVLADIEELFGLSAAGNADDKLTLTDYELALLESAYEKSVNERDTGMDAQAEYVAYGTYEPLTVTITHILNNKSGVSFTSYSHTGLPVAMFAEGVDAGQFSGYYDNTDIYVKLADMLDVQ